jgi:uncharacterized membrane protein YccC
MISLSMDGAFARQGLFSLRCLLAGGLALYIGFSLGLSRPYWALSTVYIVSQPLSGALRSKALYRLFGTVIGATAALALVPTLADSPAVLSLALACWVGLCLYISLQDRTPRSYVFLLAGYTTAIIGFPTAPTPEQIFTVAVARTEEITLGLLSATVIHSLIFPRAVGPALISRIDAWFDDAQAWTLDILTSRRDAAQEDRRKLASDAAEIRILATHLPFDTSDFRGALSVVRALHQRMILLLPLVSAVEDRLRELRRQGAASSEVEQLIQQTTEWVQHRDRSPEEGRKLMAWASRLTSSPPGSTPWTDALTENLADRLGQMIGAVLDVRELRSALLSSNRRLPPRLAQATHFRSAFHRDRFLALISAVTAVVAISACCGLWIVTSWPEGGVAALTAAVFCSFFATQDDPAPAIASFLWLTVASLPIVAVYQFAILPAIDGFPLLMASLTPTFLILGYFIGAPKTARIALPLALGVANGLALAETFSADFAGFANSNIAQVIGLAAALLATRLIRSIGVGWAMRRILRSGWRDIARLAAGRVAPDVEAFSALMLDRLGLVNDRMALLEAKEKVSTADPLRDMRIGLNIGELRRVAPELNGRARARVLVLLSILSDHYRRQAAGKDQEAPSQALGEIDGALRSVADVADDARRAAVRALVGLRRNLFPAASPFEAAAG